MTDRLVQAAEPAPGIRKPAFAARILVVTAFSESILGHEEFGPHIIARCLTSEILM